MNGLTQFLNKYDPVKINKDLIDIIKDFSKNYKFKFFTILHRLWILKVIYPLFKRKINSINREAATVLYNHPDTFITILGRFLTYFILYCNTFKLTFNHIIKSFFEENQFDMNIETEELDEGLMIKAYTMIIRSNIPTPKDLNKEKYTITSLEVNMDNSDFNLSQISYDTNIEENYKMAKILYEKSFELNRDGKLYNPNYIFDKSLLDEDKVYYKFMIAHIMSVFGGLLEATTNLYFCETK